MASESEIKFPNFFIFKILSENIGAGFRGVKRLQYVWNKTKQYRRNPIHFK